MKIGLDISQIAHGGGVATYTQNLAEKLAEVNGLDLAYLYYSLRKSYQGDLKNVKSYPLPPTLVEILFNRWRVLSVDNLIGKVDVFHSSDWLQPKTSAKKITTYHDVIPLKYPQWSHSKIVEVHKRRLELVEKEIDCVIAVSEATKRDLLEVSDIPEEKITVIYEGVGEEFKPYDKEEVEKFRQRLNLPEKFVLSIGGIGERRNLKRVKEAVKSYHLVVTGDTIPWVSNKEMPLLYCAASVLLYPSLYEGFGLPILEAMACGIPVITSNVSAMPEVGGQAAIYVNSDNLLQMEKKLKEVMEDQNLRRKMIKDGLLQSKKFTWEKCAESTTKLYEHVVS